MKKHLLLKSFLAVAWSVSAVCFLSVQIAMAGNGKISGRVLDGETRESLPGVNVVLPHTVLSEGVEVPLDRVLGGSTRTDGYYFILNIPPGTYTVEARLLGDAA